MWCLWALIARIETETAVEQESPTEAPVDEPDFE
jgi:hypothetical protein